MLSIDDVAFDNGSTVHLFKNPKLLTNIGVSKRAIVVNGVQVNASGVRVDQQGRLGDIGTAYYSENATANILSMSTLVDSGAKVNYDSRGNRFTVQPKGSETIYIFGRRQLPGSESEFYVCNMARGTEEVNTENHNSLVTTVSDNMARYTKREVIAAKKARDLLARLGYPSVENAIAMLRDGTGFDVTPYDFKVADAIWGLTLPPFEAKRRDQSQW